MNKQNSYKSKTKNTIKFAIDHMIPSYKNMPSASKAININNFLKNILKKNQIKKIMKDKEINIIDLQKNIEVELLEEYFTSKKVLHILRKKTNKFLLSANLKTKSKSGLIKLVNNLDGKI